MYNGVMIEKREELALFIPVHPAIRNINSRLIRLEKIQKIHGILPTREEILKRDIFEEPTLLVRSKELASIKEQDDLALSSLAVSAWLEYVPGHHLEEDGFFVQKDPDPSKIHFLTDETARKLGFSVNLFTQGIDLTLHYDDHFSLTLEGSRNPKAGPPLRYNPGRYMASQLTSEEAQIGSFYLEQFIERFGVPKLL